MFLFFKNRREPPERTVASGERERENGGKGP